MEKTCEKTINKTSFFHEHTGNESDIFSCTFLHHFFRSHTMNDKVFRQHLLQSKNTIHHDRHQSLILSQPHNQRFQP